MKVIEQINELKMIKAFLEALANLKLEEDFSLDVVEVEKIKEKVIVKGEKINGELGRLRL